MTIVTPALDCRADCSTAPSRPGPRTGAPATTTPSSSPARSPAAPTSRWRRSCRPAAARPRTSTRREDETFYLLEGEIEFRLGEETITAWPG